MPLKDVRRTDLSSSDIRIVESYWPIRDLSDYRVFNTASERLRVFVRRAAQRVVTVTESSEFGSTRNFCINVSWELISSSTMVY